MRVQASDLFHKGKHTCKIQNKKTVQMQRKHSRKYRKKQLEQAHEVS